MAFALGAAFNDSVSESNPTTPRGAATPAAGWVIDAAEIERFLARILPTPGVNRVISINKPWQSNDGKTHYPGEGFLTPAEAARHIAYWMGLEIRKHGKPVTSYYHTMSLQAGAVQGQTRSGHTVLRTSRRQSNSVGLRAFFLDIDVKPEKGGYASKQDGLAALLAIVKAGEAPAPTMVVDSGNGLHCYWVLDRELPAAEWTALALGFGNHLWQQGMKLHLGDSFYADNCRLLRPPGTYNCKDANNPIRTRVVGRILPHDYDPTTFARFRDTLKPTQTATVSRMTGTSPAGGAVAGLVASSSRGAARADVSALAGQAFGPAIDAGALAAGVNESLAQPVNMARIAEECEVIKDSLARGGNGDPEPLWRMMLYAASFAEDGRAWAHKLSSGDSRYTQAETDAKFDVVAGQRTRAGGKLGWPTCAQFNQHSAACASCKHAGKVRTPMHTGKDDSDLPTGYYRQGGTVWKDLLLSSRKDAEALPTEVFAYGIRDAFIEATPEGPTLNAEIHVRNERPSRLRVPLFHINIWRDKVFTILGQHGITTTRALRDHTQEFFVSFIRHLQSVAASVQKRDAFGWTKTRDSRTGFAFGGRIIRPDGSNEPAGSFDTVLESRYQPRGRPDSWQRAAGMLVSSGRLDLQAILATAFAAPLVRYTGLSGLLVSAYSPRSGVQKSTAMQVAQAVWGHPVQAMNRIDDTGLSVANKLGHLRHLPIFWDELHLDAEKDTFAKLAFTLTQGSEKSRLTSDIQQRAGGSWATMLVSASNFSVQDEMVRKAKNTTAGINRVFEFTVRPGAPHQLVSMSDATMLLGQLHDNHGHAGERYAALLAAEDARLGQRLSGLVKALETTVGAQPDERFWLFTAATIILGAAMARSAGICGFDVPGLHAFVLDTLRAQRRQRTSLTTDPTSADHAADILGRFIAHCRQRNLCLETDTLAPGGTRGKAKPLALRMPSDEARRALRSPVLHLAHDQGAARILKHEFHEWMAESRIPIRPVIDALETHGGLRSQRVTWAAGTEYSAGQTWVYDVVLQSGSAPHNGVGNLFDWGTPSGQNGAQTPNPAGATTAYNSRSQGIPTP